MSAARLAALAAALSAAAPAAGDDVFDPAAAGPAELILRNGKIATNDPARPFAAACAVAGGHFTAVGDEAEVMNSRGPDTRVIDLGGRAAVPGLNDSHLHAVRAGRFYNLELRWDGVKSLRRGLEMIREQAGRTPEGQWVRVVGGWSPFQFEEKRLPTPAELTAAAPDTPVFVLFLYSRGFLNRAGAAALGITEQTEPPKGGRYVFVDGGVELRAEPSPVILYRAVGRLPELSPADRVNSTRQFYRELARFGLTSAVDAGGGGHTFPDDYAATKALAEAGAMPLRVSAYLFAQKPGSELAAYRGWLGEYDRETNWAVNTLNGYVLEGGGENLVWSAGDYENFLSDRPELSPGMKAELKDVLRLLLRNNWPVRIHATYDQSISRMLDAFEELDGEIDLTGRRWAIDHAETVGPANIERIKRLGGGVAVQDRMAFAGEYFAARYGDRAASQAPPLRRLVESGVPLGAGTDATRVSSYNPWVSIAWMVTGKTVGGYQLYGPDNRLTRAEALRLYTVGSAWFSGEDGVKGRVAPGQLADLAVLSADYFAVPEGEIGGIESVLTLLGGRPTYAAAEFKDLAPAVPPVSPEWSPVAAYGGYQK